MTGRQVSDMRTRDARPEDIDLLRTIPDRRVGRVNDLWEELRHGRPMITYRSLVVAGNRSP